MTRLPLLLALLALPAAAQEQALDATVCRADHPTQCMCLTILTEGQDAGGQAQLAQWVGQNPGWVVKAFGRCTERVPV